MPEPMIVTPRAFLSSWRDLLTPSHFNPEDWTVRTQERAESGAEPDKEDLASAAGAGSEAAGSGKEERGTTGVPASGRAVPRQKFWVTVR